MIISSLQSKRKSNPKKGSSQSSGDDVVWLSSYLSLFVLTSPWYCVLMCVCVYIYFILFYLQVEVPPPTIGRTLEEEVVTTSFASFPGIEKEALGGGMVEEIGQPMQGVQSILSTIPLAT